MAGLRNCQKVLSFESINIVSSRQNRNAHITIIPGRDGGIKPRVQTLGPSTKHSEPVERVTEEDNQ